MKKLLLILSIFVVSLSAFAADLNPFAYNLKSEYNDKTQTLTINFTLNAPATYVKLAISDGVSDVWTKEYLAGSYQAGKVPKATYTETIDALTLPQGKSLTWRVDVKGAAVGSPTFVKNNVRLYAPTSVDIDNNPENANFGTVFCVEGLNGAYQTSGYTNFISYEDGAGLYLLNADGTAREMPFQTEKVRYGYNGGVVNQPNRTRPFFGNNGQYDLKGYNAYRVRVSDDGRIFVTAFSTNGHVLWEAKKECFSATTQAEWSANTGWYKIMTTADSNTKMATTKRTCSHDYCGVYSLFEGNASTGTFIAGPNLGFDVKGSGKDLKLLMLSGCKQAVVYSTPAHFYCDEYDLGTATLWNTAPSRRIFAGHSNGVDIVNAQGVQVQYDKSDNVWVCQHRATTEGANTTLARVNRASSPTTDDQNHNITGGKFENVEATTIYRRCGAIRFNEDFTQVVIASNAHGAGGGFTVYPVNASTGLPNWNSGTQVDTYSKTGNSLMDFAWDYAGNLYIAADAATNGERIAVYAMPHTADRVVSTPAASKYAFTVNCQEGAKYQVTTICNPPEAGTITCSIGGNARAAGVLNDIPSCTELTVTATPEDGYKFLNWTDGNDNVLSTDKEFTFYVTENITLKANFEYATYDVTWWNLFKNGEDIGKESTAYPGTNERLWRLYQIEFEKYNTSKSGDAMRWHYDTHKPDGASKTQFNVGTFVYYEDRGPNNKDFLTSSTTNTTTPFAWLGKYIKDVSGTESSETAHWQYVIYLFFNRTNKAYNASEYDCTINVTWTDNTKSFSKDYGMPEYWRPWWTEAVCNLEKTISSETSMPVTWNQDITCAAGDVAKFGRFNGTAPTSNKETQPSLWYQWNTAPKSDQLLAWRDGGTAITDKIVHHVDRNDMKLYATYVDKTLQEDDPDPTGEYDAKNSDVLSLLANEKHGTTDHNITIDRKFVAGMYNTVCFPFDLHRSLFPTKLKDAEVLTFDGVTVTGNEYGEPVAVLNFITLEEYWQKWNEEHPDNQVDLEDPYMEAGVPYLIKPKTDISDDYLTYSGLKYWKFFNGEREPYSKHHNGVTFQGVLNPTTLPEDACILVADNRLAKVAGTGEDRKIKGYRGYFVIDNITISQMAEEGNVYFSFNKPVTTSVPLAPEAEQPKKTKVRKVMYDGQIYILRGDEVYTITGHRVK